MADDARPLQGRTALISGASRGIGRECARQLSRAGARLFLLGRDMEALRTLADEVGGTARAILCDFSSPTLVDAVAADLRYQRVSPDIIVNNAAQFLLAPAEDTTTADFQRLVAVNLTSQFALLRGFLGEMRTRESGDIVTIGSIADRNGLPGNAAYSASKFGLRGLHSVLRRELRGSGVRVTLISPGRVDTSMWDDIDRGGQPDITPRERMLSAEDVAEAVLFAVTRPRRANVDELRLSHA